MNIQQCDNPLWINVMIVNLIIKEKNTKYYTINYSSLATSLWLCFVLSISFLASSIIFFSLYLLVVLYRPETFPSHFYKSPYLYLFIYSILSQFSFKPTYL